MKIPKEIFEKIEGYSKQLGKDIEILKKQLIEFYEADKATHKRSSEDKNWEIANKALRRILRHEDGGIRSKAIAFTGYVFGDSGLIDFVDLMKKKAKRVYGIDRERAIAKHLTNDRGEPLDTREKVNFEDNSRYLEPFREEDHSWQRTIYAMSGKGPEMKEIKFSTIVFRDEQAHELKPNLNSGAQFRANEKTSSPYYELNATSVTKLKDYPIKADIEKMIRTCGPKIYRITELDKVVDLIEKRAVVLVEAIVHSINPEPNAKTGNRSVLLDDEDLPMDAKGTWCYMPYHIPLDFKEDSEVIFLATLSKTTLGGKEVVVMNGLGYYAPSDLRN